MLTVVAEMNIAAGTPDRMIMVVKGLSGRRARKLAQRATSEARSKMPKLTGAAASRLQPIYGKGYFGIWWGDSYVWFQENGIKPFTMKNLAGKTIPMWIDDPTGRERMNNPKAQTRTTASGRTQVLIFRKVAMPGQTRSDVKRNPKTGELEHRRRPASYPGAPGRIAKRESAQPFTTRGKKGGEVAKGNVGVRWRHPGLSPRQFLNNAITMAAQGDGILPIRCYAADGNFRSVLNLKG